LPAFLDEVVLRRLSLAGATVDVALKRAGAGVVVDVLARDGISGFSPPASLPNMLLSDRRRAFPAALFGC
jgi:hypothetical protein